MPVSEQTPYVEYEGNGTTNIFPLTFDCDDQEHLIVKVDDDEATIGTWSLVVDSVVFAQSPSVGVKISIERNTPLERNSDYQAYDNSFRPSAVNKDFDLIWRKLQELGYRDSIIWLALLKEIFDRQESEEDLKSYIDQMIALITGNPTFEGITTEYVLENGDTQKNINSQFTNDLNARYTKIESDQLAQKKLIPDLFLPSLGNSKKLMVRRAQYVISDGSTVGSRYWVITSKAGNPENHLLFELRRGVVTSTGSLGGAAELLRVTSIYDGGQAWVGRHGKLDQSSEADWVEVEYNPVGYVEKMYHSTLAGLSCWKYYTSGNPVPLDQYITFNAYFNSRGRANIQFYSTVASCELVEIYIDNALKETISLKSATAAIYRHEMKAVQGYHQVKIVRKATGIINVFGVNYTNVSESDNNEPYDSIVFWHKNEMYSSSEGANEYAILEDTSDLLGGSLHGGEKLTKQTFVIDGIVGDPLGNIRIATNLEIRQETEITWTPSIKLRVLSSHFFNTNGGYQIDTTFINKVSSKTFYTAMHTTPNSFSKVVAPNFLDLSLEADGFKTLNRSNTVVQEDPTTNKRIYTQTTIFNEENNVYGAPTVRKVSGSYNKLYYGAAISSPVALNLGDFSVSTRKIFT